MASRTSHLSAARSTIRALVEEDRLDRRRDAVVVRALEAMALELDVLAAAEDQVETECEGCGMPVVIAVERSNRGAGMVRLSRELRAWWTAVRAPKEVSPGATVVDLFAAGDAAARDCGTG